MAYRKLRAAVSLIELVTGFAIVGLVSILVASIYFAHFRLFSNQNNAIDVSSQNKIALSEITNQIKESDTVVSTCTNCGGDTTSATVLVIRLWPLDVNGDPKDPPDANSYDYVVYKLNAQEGTLIKKTVAGPSTTRQTQTKIIAAQLSNLGFTYDNVDPVQSTEVTVTVTTTGTSNGKTQTTTESDKAVLRNK